MTLSCQRHCRGTVKNKIKQKNKWWTNVDVTDILQNKQCHSLFMFSEICVLVARPWRCLVESCPLTKLNGGLSRLHSADEDAVSWLTNYGKWHAYEKKKKWELYSRVEFLPVKTCFWQTWGLNWITPVKTTWRIPPVPLIRHSQHSALYKLLWTNKWTSSSAVAKRPHDASCLSVISVNSTKPQVVFYC